MRLPGCFCVPVPRSLWLVATGFALALMQNAQAGGTHYPDGHGGEVFFPMGSVSFADEVVRFVPGDPAADDEQYSEAERGLGAPRYTEDEDDFVTLGCAGELVLRLTDNQLIDVPGPDLYVFEIGPDTEPTALAVSDDGEAWTRVGTISGGKAEIDLAPFVGADDSFRFVKLVDLKQACSSATPGADVDAVGAIGSASRIALDSSVLFDSGEHQLKPGAFEELDAVLAGIDNPAASQMEVAGHTDSVGDREDNRVLSRNRAQAVADFLREKGNFDAESITTKAFGETRPIASNDTAQGRARNRRVELTVRTVPAAETGAPEVEMLGVWAGESGRSADRIVELRHENGTVRGWYDFDGSRLLGKFVDETTFEGFWIKDRSRRKCDTEKGGSRYWGHMRIEFDSPERDHFDGFWRYCGSSEDDWSPKGWRGIKRLL